MVCRGSISARFSAIPASFISSAVGTTAENKICCYRAVTPRWRPLKCPHKPLFHFWCLRNNNFSHVSNLEYRYYFYVPVISISQRITWNDHKLTISLKHPCCCWLRHSFPTSGPFNAVSASQTILRTKNAKQDLIRTKSMMCQWLT